MNDNPIISATALCKDKDQTNTILSNHNTNNTNQTLKVMNKTKNEDKRAIIREYFRISGYHLSNSLQRMKKSITSWIKTSTLSLQLLFLYFVLLLLLSVVLFALRLWIYNNIIVVDYLTGHKAKFSTGLIQEILTSGLREINLDFYQQTQNQISQILLMKIYMKELISRGLISPDSLTNIESTSGYYKKLNNSDSTYTINEKAVTDYFNKINYITKNEDSLYNLMLIDYIFAPLLIQEAGINRNKLISTYLLTYEVDMSDKQIKSSRYFQYPLYKMKSFSTENFKQTNKLTDPEIKTDSSYNINSDDEINFEEYFKTNWFYEKDISFRQEVDNKLSKSKISFYTYADLEQADVHRYHYEVLQFSIPRTSSNPLVINLIYKYEEEYQRTKVKNFSFLLQDLKFNSKTDNLTKYSDGTSFVITKNAIAALSVSDHQHEYFTFEMNHKNNLFYENGMNYDTFDLEYLNDMASHYNIQVKMEQDIMLFKIMNFYYHITMMRKKDISLSNSSFFYYVTNYTKQEEIRELCDTVNIIKYYSNLKQINPSLDCFDDYNMYFYHFVHKMEYNKNAINYLPNCLCIPFYCLDVNQTNLKEGKYKYTAMFQVPNNCQSNYVSYYSDKRPFGQFESIFNSNDLFLKNNRIVFNYFPIPYLKYLTMHNVNTIFNSLITEAEYVISTEIRLMKQELITCYFILYLGFGVLFLITSTCRLYSRARVFKIFMNCYQEYLFKLDNKNSTEKNLNIITKDANLNISKLKSEINWNERIDSTERKALITSNNNSINDLSTDNILIDSLFQFYCKFHKKSKSSLMKKFNRKNINSLGIENTKLHFLRNTNELFYILSWITDVTPKYQMDIKPEINFYKNKHLILSNGKKNNPVETTNAFQSFFGNNVANNKIDYSDISEAILCELLSSESLFDEGIMYNLKFNYKHILQLKQAQKGTNKETPYEDNQYKLSEKRRDIFYEECEKEFKGTELNKINEIKSAFNFYLTKVYFDLMSYKLFNSFSNTNQVCTVKMKSTKSRVMFKE